MVQWKGYVYWLSLTKVVKPFDWWFSTIYPEYNNILLLFPYSEIVYDFEVKTYSVYLRFGNRYDKYIIIFILKQFLLFSKWLEDIRGYLSYVYYTEML